MVAKIVELLDVQIMGGQECLTRFHYLDADGVADEAVLVADYITDVLPVVTPMQTLAVQHVAIRHRQVYPTAMLLQETPVSPTSQGTNTSQIGPDYGSISIKFGIGDTTYLTGGVPPHIRKGGKHLPGLPANQAENTLLGGSWSTMVAAWFAEAQDPGTDPWQLVVASFELTRSHSVNTTTVRTVTKATYSPTVTKYAPVLSAVGASASTQNTRKQLRGRTY
jgi:hypothetical protein